MARTIQTRKRSGGFLRRSGFKRRRFFGRRRFRRGFGGRRGASTTSRASGALSYGTFKTRRLRPRTFRRIIWRDTIASQHWRSVSDSTQSAVTPNNLIQATLVSGINGLRDNFWTALGGAVASDSGVVVPTFVGDIILRGGMSRITVTNRANPSETMPSDPVRVTVFAVWTKSNPAALTFTSAPPTLWDPSLTADFDRYGKVMWKREALLKGDGEVVEYFFRYKPQKIDQAEFNNGGSRLQWFVLVSQTSNVETTPTAETVDIVISHNVSFSGDAQ